MNRMALYVSCIAHDVTRVNHCIIWVFTGSIVNTVMKDSEYYIVDRRPFYILYKGNSLVLQTRNKGLAVRHMCSLTGDPVPENYQIREHYPPLNQELSVDK